MHSRSHEHLVQNPLETDRQPQIAMVEECVGLKNQFVNGKYWYRDPDEQYLDDTKSSGHCDFAEMKTKSRRNIEDGIDVVHIMKAPEKPNAVICEVALIKF